MKNKIRIFSASALSLLTLSSSSIINDGKIDIQTQDSKETIKPNIIFIYADQWRRMAISHYRDSKYNNTFNEGDPLNTPALDKIISEGMLMNNCVVAEPISSPNRASLITGQFPQVHGLIDNTDYERFSLDNETVADVLDKQGYNTAHLGKWHIAVKDKSKFTTDLRERRGFEYWYGAPGVDHQHFDSQYYFFKGAGIPKEIDGLGEYVPGGKELPMPFKPTSANNGYKDKKLREQESWVCDHLTRKAINYMSNIYNVRDSKKPFALYISFPPPHTIHGPKPKFDEKANHYSYSLLGRSGEIYGKDANGDKVSEYRAPKNFEKDFLVDNLPKRPNVPEGHYSHSGPYNAVPGYFGAIESMDKCFAELDEYLKKTDDPRYPGKKLYETSIVMITADHGEMMGSQGRMTKGVPYEEAISVPFIIRWPGKIKAGSESDALCSTVDISPSLLGLIGAKFTPNKKVEGLDMSNLLLNRKSVGRDYAYIAQREWRAVRSKDGIIIAEFARRKNNIESIKYYNLIDDPFEQRPIDITSGDFSKLKDAKAIQLIWNNLKESLIKYDKLYRL